MTQLQFILGTLVGLRITQIARVLYEYRGKLEPDDGALEIGTGSHVVVLDGDADGESLRAREGGWRDRSQSHSLRRMSDTSGNTADGGAWTARPRRAIRISWEGKSRPFLL